MATSSRWHCPTCNIAVSTPYCAACGERRLQPSDLRLSGLLTQIAQSMSSVDGRLLRTSNKGVRVHICFKQICTLTPFFFVTLEDEHGMVNVVVWEHVAQRGRKALLAATLLAVRGRWEQVDGVAHLIAQDMQDLSEMLGSLRTTSRDFH